MNRRIQLSLQGRINESKDMETIDYIVDSVKSQKDLISTGSAMMEINIPDYYYFFKHHRGRDFFVLVMGLDEKLMIHIKEIANYMDIPFGLCDRNQIPLNILKRFS